jgi:glycosyltransferase involved in cell wall biosynthesis
VRALDRFGGAQPFDLAIAHHPAFAPVMRRAPSCRGAARLYAFRTPWEEEDDAGLPSRPLACFRRRLERGALRASNAALVLSRYSAAQLAATHGELELPVYHAPGGVDTDRFRPREPRWELRQRLGLPPSAFLILTVRPLLPRMGLENLITAMAGIAAAYPEARLVVGGEGPLEGALRRQVVQQRLGRAVTFAGFIPEEHLPEYYAAADLFVMPTRCREAFGLAAVEALASGTPVFATPVGALPELLTYLDPRALFTGASAGAIADGIIRFLPDLHHDEELRRRCRQFALEHYAWDAVVPALEDLLYEAVARRALPQPAAPAPVEGLAPRWPCFE